MKVAKIGHLGFICHDLERSIDFYQNKLGFKHKFTLTYGDWLDHMKKGDPNLDPAFAASLEAKREKPWIVYFEFGDEQFFELFDKGGASVPSLPGGDKLNYSHVALVVEDIHAVCAELKEKGVPLDSDPKMGLEHTWQMWATDPDGNRVEFMQYTDASWQLTGRP